MYKLIGVSKFIQSSYRLQPLSELEMGVAPKDVCDALIGLVSDVKNLQITELWRSPARQRQARIKYENWLRAGKPEVGTSLFVPETMKADFVAKPGKSMHNAGRAIDVNVETLRASFGSNYLDVFWPIARRWGWVPIISKPTEGVSECWHFDNWGPWQIVKDRLGYEQGALAASLAVGCAGEWQNDVRRAQAHIHRLGYDIGEIDGIAGKRTLAAEKAILGDQPVNNLLIIGQSAIADELEKL